MTLSLCPISGRLRDSPSLIAQLNMDDMTRKTNAQLTEEVRQLRQALEDRDSELISFATYQRDWANRWALHADEWHNLYQVDCPKYWSMIKQAWSDLQTALPVLALNK